MRVPVAVRLDIRPRLRIPEGLPVAQRRRRRLPALTVPAVGYWLAMGAATYAFAHLGPYPLEPSDAQAAEPAGEQPLERGLERAPQPAEPATPPVAQQPSEPVAAEEGAASTAADDAARNRAEASTALRDSSITDSALAEDRGASERAARESSRDSRDDVRRSGARRDSEDARSATATPPPTATTPWEPHFTDSSRPTPPERAGDGPRIAGLFERDGTADEPRPPSQPDAPSAPPNGDSAPSRALTSCEAAIARNNEQMDLTHRGPADVTREAYAGILENGRYLSGCAVPPRSVIEICAAVLDGKAVGITVTTSPPSAPLAGCVRSAVARLKFPANSRLDVTHTRFDAVSR